jgi:hypothetical protein
MEATRASLRDLLWVLLRLRLLKQLARKKAVTARTPLTQGLKA